MPGARLKNGWRAASFGRVGWMSRQDLLDAGYSVKGVASAVRKGTIVRVRRGHYCTPDVDEALQRAVRVGGSLTCLSELRRRRIWVLDDDRLHVQLATTASRLRNPDDRAVRFRASGREVLHWHRGASPAAPGGPHASTIEALICAARCVGRRALVASIDSAMRQGVVTRGDLHRLTSALPLSFRDIPRLVDPRAESGLETIVRVLLRDLGLHVKPQVLFRGIGRVDLLVEDWIVVETDGVEFHDAIVSTRDRRRDAALSSRGYTVLRFRYAQVVFEPLAVAAAIVSAVGVHRRVRNSGRIAGRARSRMRQGRIS
jgi:very-short-patch-repair endonuclease